MKARTRKAIINRYRPKWRRFGASVFYGGAWQRVSRDWWSREKYGGTLWFGKREVKIDLTLMRKAKPLSLRGL